MTDRVIGILAVLLTILFGIAGFYIESIPSWATKTGVLVGVLLLGFSFGIFYSHKKLIKPKPSDIAKLQLHIWGDNRFPAKLDSENIFRWYYLRGGIQGMNKSGEPIQQYPLNILFVSFKNDVKVSTLKIESPDIELPVYEVKEFNQRYAIIVFLGELEAGTLEVNVTP